MTSGLASISATANNTLGGPYNVTATLGSLTVNFVLTNAAAVPASVTATGGTPQSAVIGVAFATSLQATVKDAGGNPLSGITVAFAAPAPAPVRFSPPPPQSPMRPVSPVSPLPPTLRRERTA